jgi:hypothetical protein
MHAAVSRNHDFVRIMLEFHWREVTRADWRPEQVRIIDRCICGTINGLGINTLPKEVAENRQRLGSESRGRGSFRSLNRLEPMNCRYSPAPGRTV